MFHANPLPQIVILLAAAVVVVTLFRSFRLSPILGYLAAGAVIGPFGLRVIENVEQTATIAELGVVFLLFVIGTELSFARVMRMGKQVFGIGGAQVFLSGLALAAIGWWGFCYSLVASLVIGVGLALSSTALVMQLLEEKRSRNTPKGRLILAILLMQDLAVVPLLVLVPLLAAAEKTPITQVLLHASVNAAIAFAAVLLSGRFLLRPVFRLIASLENSELFSAFTLLLVLGIAFGFQAAGLSMALGAFVAGLLVAETEYRHQVEADITPYKGLFLGLFFMVVGMRVNFAPLLDAPWHIAGMVTGMMLLKFIILFGICAVARVPLRTAIPTGLLLAQGGEFAFIIFQLGEQMKIIPTQTVQLFTLVITLSMVCTPWFYAVGGWLMKRLGTKQPMVSDAIPNLAETADLHHHVVIIGYGRVGQTIGKLLATEGVNYIALDTDAQIVTQGRERGRAVYFGDGTRREVLQAVSLEQARAAVVTTHDFYTANKAVIALKNLAPDVPIVARGRDLQHLQKLELAGADVAIAEKFEASLQLGGAVMKQMDIPEQEIHRIIELFRERDYALARISE
jgi:CPA2 family monovalent cation:H+ antiporter-2